MKHSPTKPFVSGAMPAWQANISIYSHRDTPHSQKLHQRATLAIATGRLHRPPFDPL